jgi:uncharacterized membrane protein HdeD (DUF308 family)
MMGDAVIGIALIIVGGVSVYAFFSKDGRKLVTEHFFWWKSVKSESDERIASISSLVIGVIFLLLGIARVIP